MLRQTFYDQLNVSVFGKEYIYLTKTCKSRILIPESGYIICYIFPTSLGGLNTSENKVKLTYFEYCVACALLAQAIPCYKTLKIFLQDAFDLYQDMNITKKEILEKEYHWIDLQAKALDALKVKNNPGLRKRNSGTVAVTNGIVTKYVLGSEMLEWISKGWKKGVSAVRKESLRKSHTGLKSKLRGRVTITDGNLERKVSPEDLQFYLDQGWKLGRCFNFSTNYREAMKNKTNKNKIRICKEGVGKIVSVEELQSYLDQGWKRGRK